MPAVPPPRAIVVGAGIAGLAAARRLAQSGWTVKVLEAAPQVGGRMVSESVGGFVVDGGAQFLSAGYAALLGLVREVGLAAALRPVSPWNAIVRSGRVRRLHARNPLAPLLAGLLTPGEWCRLAGQTLRLRRALGGFPLDDYGAWRAFDTESAAEWANRTVGRGATDYLVEPALEGYYFQAPETTSRALFHLVSAFAWRRCATLTIAGGIARLPLALAAPLDVACRTAALRIHDGAREVVVETAAERFSVDGVVLAVPAPAARRIYATADARERQLMETPYSAAINIVVMTAPGYRLPRALRDVYGVAVPRRERRHLAAIAIESNKCRDRAPHGELFHLMLCGASAAALLDAPDETVLAEVLPEAGRILPGLDAAVAATRICRWHEAEPRSPIGRAGMVHAYRSSAAAAPRRIVLAGDYVNTPFTDGAVASGHWAADALRSARAP